MSEETNRHEPELSEAALEGVSGGADKLYKYMHEAAKICGYCDCAQSCSHNKVGLAEYLQENGPDSVTHEWNCPFYRKG